MREYDKDYGFECEQCGSCVGGKNQGCDDFYESLAYKKDDGWINRTIDGEWYNFCCEECYEEFKENNK